MSNINYNFNKLTPFKFFCLTNFPFIEEDFDSLTTYELLCKIVEYLNKVINTTNSIGTQTEELTNAFNELKSYVDNYFTNLDVQEEINNKLNEMAQDGTLQEIITAYLKVNGVLGYDTKNAMKNATNLIKGSIAKTLGDLEYSDGKGAFYKVREIKNTDVIDDDNIIALSDPDSIAEKIPYSGYDLQKEINDINNEIDTINDKEGLYIASFFEGDDVTGKLRLAVSKDGFNFARINTKIDVNMRDPSIMFKNNKYFIAYTNNAESYDFKIATSNDLQIFTEHEINIGLSEYSRVWAPEWFEDDNGDLYILVSAGNDLNSMKLFKAKCTNIENLIFDTPVEINLNNNDSKIDPFMLKVNNIYYLAYTTYLDLEYNREICKIYSSTDLENWTLVNNNVFPRYWAVEAVCITYQNGRFTVYGDMLQSNDYYAYFQTDDLSQTNKTWKLSESLVKLRHGTIIYTKDPKAIEIVNNNNINYTYRQELVHGLFHIRLNDHLKRLVIQPKMMYAINGTATVDEIYNPFGLEEFPFCFAGANATTLTIGKIQNAEGTMKTINVVLSNSATRNEKTFKYSLLSECFPPYMP